MAMAAAGMRDGKRALHPVVLGLFAAALVGLALGACGGEGDRRSDGQVLRVGVAPVSDAAALFLGRDKGFFEDVNLEVEPRLMQSSSTIVAAVVSGEAEFGFSETTSIISARSKGLPLRIVTPAALGGSDEAEGGSSHLIVKRDGPITTLEDLKGRTVSVNTLGTVGHLTVNAALEKHGVDPSKVEFIEVPITAALAALESGRVDAITVPEPFATLALDAGHRSLLRPVIDAAPDFIVAAYFTADEYTARHEDVVDRFVRAVTRSLRYAARHPEQVREVISTYTEIPPEVARRMTLPDFSRPKDYSTLQMNIDLAVKYGFIDRKPKLSELLYES
jgi:NitT/TauT family transport system substrate-binding protein